MSTTKNALDYARRELRLRMGHAIAHGVDGQHHHLNIDGFMRELERFIDAKIAIATTRGTRT